MGHPPYTEVIAEFEKARAARLEANQEKQTGREAEAAARRDALLRTEREGHKRNCACHICRDLRAGRL
jgi:alkyl sulfatase BDS1-like metallo-beta-lactamase superfamily hydrolase